MRQDSAYQVHRTKRSAYTPFSPCTATADTSVFSHSSLLPSFFSPAGVPPPSHPFQKRGTNNESAAKADKLKTFHCSNPIPKILTRESDPEGSKTGAGSGGLSRGNGSSQPRSTFPFSRTSLAMIRCANGSFEDVNALNSQTKEVEMPELTYLRSLLFSRYLVLLRQRLFPRWSCNCGSFFFNLFEVLFFFPCIFERQLCFLTFCAGVSLNRWSYKRQFQLPLSKDFDVWGFKLLLHLYISEAGNRRFVYPSALSFCCCCSFHRACVYSNFISAWRNVETRLFKASWKTQVSAVNSLIVHVCKICKMWWEVLLEKLHKELVS